ncbi:carboxymuconolactone decarboxylase family protein [Phreatobacter stygius]|uniref:Carboxymuconolactone decarboxylase family protein n=1 Tax=Phreatobacter stygius TaxID=1940610 RepID=A0A4D7BK02_9HYPH|nr:carboxymuconolactone decarboxylase family protein [Phreatobacter stygius]QCI68082.1 carboxymuconolactone decarboxylase family protein [Phreatobacter stygius]
MSASAARLTQAQFIKAVPKAYAALRTLNAELNGLGLDPTLVELVKIRASQINGCAYCVHSHLSDARKIGVPPAKLDLLVAWAEAGVHSPRERAALAWAEAITGPPGPGATDAAYAAVREQFDEAEVGALTMVIATINALNRIAASMRYALPVA